MSVRELTPAFAMSLLIDVDRVWIDIMLLITLGMVENLFSWVLLQSIRPENLESAVDLVVLLVSPHVGMMPVQDIYLYPRLPLGTVYLGGTEEVTEVAGDLSFFNPLPIVPP